MGKKRRPKKVDLRRIQVFSKDPFIPTDPAFILNLPIEIIEQTLFLAIDSSIPPIDQQWNRIYQAIVCRDWYRLRKERTKFVFVSVLQMKAMIRMLQNGEIDVEGVKEVIFNLLKEPSYGWLPGVENVIRLSPKIERLTIQIGQGYSGARDKRFLGDSPILEAMKKLDLRELCILSGITRDMVAP